MAPGSLRVRDLITQHGGTADHAIACQLIVLENRITEMAKEIKALKEKKCSCNETQDLSGETNIPIDLLKF